MGVDPFMKTKLLPLAAVFLLAASAQPPRKVTAAMVEQWMTELSNWGRWGKEDQLGALNLITSAKRKQAAALVKEGVSVSLAHDTLKEKAADNDNPFSHEMRAAGQNALEGKWSVDVYSVLYHGYAHTHMDSLCHMFHKGKMYNGFSQQEVAASGARKLAITNAKGGIFTRGILMDIPRLKGLPYLEPGTPVFAEDLEAWEKKAGVKVSPGDALLLRTGRWARREKLGPWNVGRNEPGLHASTAQWLKDRGVALVGSDLALDVVPSLVQGINLPVHTLVITAL